ncbi:MAG: hypothetical protein LBU36_06185 [Clostridiales bacterium]|jgi:hypothetical protein|nr:hypothetical protein [Clostridiales bacterium]
MKNKKFLSERVGEDSSYSGAEEAADAIEPPKATIEQLHATQTFNYGGDGFKNYKILAGADYYYVVGDTANSKLGGPYLDFDQAGCYEHQMDGDDVAPDGGSAHNGITTGNKTGNPPFSARHTYRAMYADPTKNSVAIFGRIREKAPPPRFFCFRA